MSRNGEPNANTGNPVPKPCEGSSLTSQSDDTDKIECEVELSIPLGRAFIHFLLLVRCHLTAAGSSMLISGGRALETVIQQCFRVLEFLGIRRVL